MDEAVPFHRFFETAAPQVQIIQYLSKFFNLLTLETHAHGFHSADTSTFCLSNPRIIILRKTSWHVDFWDQKKL